MMLCKTAHTVYAESLYQFDELFLSLSFFCFQDGEVKVLVLVLLCLYFKNIHDFSWSWHMVTTLCCRAWTMALQDARINTVSYFWFAYQNKTQDWRSTISPTCLCLCGTTLILDICFIHLWWQPECIWKNCPYVGLANLSPISVLQKNQTAWFCSCSFSVFSVRWPHLCCIHLPRWSLLLRSALHRKWWHLLLLRTRNMLPHLR